MGLEELAGSNLLQVLDERTKLELCDVIPVTSILSHHIHFFLSAARANKMLEAKLAEAGTLKKLLDAA